MEILLVRHGESKGNTGEVDPQQDGDHTLNLTELGKRQANDLGANIDKSFLNDAIIYNSPYERTRETLKGILKGAGVFDEREDLLIYEDPRLREVEHGFHGTSEDVDQQYVLQDTHGKFYYRFKGGESPADCYDRVASFLESLQRQVERKGKKKILIVSHGLTIRCFVMRFLHLSVEQFESIKNPSNCSLVRIAKLEDIEEEKRVFQTKKWAVEGLQLRMNR